MYSIIFTNKCVLMLYLTKRFFLNVFLCVISGVTNVNKFEVRLLPSSHLKIKYNKVQECKLIT